MALITRMLNYDHCVYWAPTGSKTQFGKVLFENPIELGCRWEEGVFAKRDADGDEQVFNGTVYVGQDLNIDGMLWHGRLNAVPVEDDPTIPPEDAKLIRRFDKIPNLRNTRVLRKASI